MLSNISDALTFSFHNEWLETLKFNFTERSTSVTAAGTLSNRTCYEPDEDFPSFLNDRQLKSGGVVLALLIGIYCFTLLAIICDSYFLPCVKRICETLSLSQDVAAATFMAMATSAPELFINTIGTFITESDIGIGTILGSSMFNTLGVACLGGLAAASPIQINWWPVTRDCSIYTIVIIVLVGITWDGIVVWYETVILFSLYFIYLTVMFNNQRVTKVLRKLVSCCILKSSSSTAQLTNVVVTDVESNTSCSSITKEYSRGIDSISSSTGKTIKHSSNSSLTDKSIKEYTDIEENVETSDDKVNGFKMFFTIPTGHWAKKVLFVYTWPITLLLFIVIPSPTTKPKLFPLAFFLCIIFIGANSYVVSWMISIAGRTFNIPDAILGITFLAAGGCIPEAVSVIIMSRKGVGSMGVSNALGANTTNILLSLGLPWFIKSMVLIAHKSDKQYIAIESGVIQYTIIGLILVAFSLFITLYINKFQLSKSIGVALGIIYFIFLSTVISLELILNKTVFCN